MITSATPLPSLPQDAVDQVLVRRDRRLERNRRSEGIALSLAAALHAAVLLGAFALSHFRPEPKPLEYVSAQIIPAQALGVDRPGQRTSQAPPTPQMEAPAPPAAETAPSEPEPEPEPPRKPEPKPTAKPEPTPPAPNKPPSKPPSILPRPKGWDDPPPSANTTKPSTAAPKSPATTPPKTTTPSAGSTGAEVGKGDEEGRRGSATASPLGTSAFGSEVAGLDNPDFTYGYYIDRMLQLIDKNWTRPGVTGRVRTIVHFRVARDGRIEDLEIVETSGYSAFDIAALRAVKNAAPLPPLPASYRNPTLGVNLIVR